MKTTILVLITLFISLIFCNKVTADNNNNFFPGYIITNSRDTVKGYIQQFKNESKKCCFKKKLDDNVIEYSPLDISAYRFDNNGKFFISKNAPLKSGNEVRFLEYLIKGKANLYFMRDVTDYYFIETDKNKIIELSNTPKVEESIIQNRTDNISTRDSTYAKQPNYIGVLKYYLADYPEITHRIERLQLDTKELIKLVDTYNSKMCDTERCIIYEKKIKPIKVNIFAEAGVSLSNNINVPSDYLFTLTNTLINFNPAGLIGFNFEFENIFLSNEFSTIRVGVRLQEYSKYSVHSANVSGDLNVIAVKVPITYNYKFSLGKIKPYIGGGLINNFISTNKTISLPLTNYYDKPIKLPSYQVGLIGQIGAKYTLENKHSIYFELNYEYSKSMESIQIVRNSIDQNVSLVLAYQL